MWFSNTVKNVEKTLVALSAHVKNRIEQNTCSNLAKSPTTLCLFSPLLSVLSALLQGGAPKLETFGKIVDFSSSNVMINAVLAA